MQNYSKFFGLLILLFGSQISFGMQEMHPILEWKDVEPFAGKVVIFSADNYFYTGRNGYPIDQEGNLRAGFIDQTPSKCGFRTIGYDMKRLLKKDAISSRCVLDNQGLDLANLKMREATPEERTKILEAIDAGTAELDYMIGPEEKFRQALKE